MLKILAVISLVAGHPEDFINRTSLFLVSCRNFEIVKVQPVICSDVRCALSFSPSYDNFTRYIYIYLQVRMRLSSTGLPRVFYFWLCLTPYSRIFRSYMNDGRQNITDRGNWSTRRKPQVHGELHWRNFSTWDLHVPHIGGTTRRAPLTATKALRTVNVGESWKLSDRELDWTNVSCEPVSTNVWACLSRQIWFFQN